MTLCIPTYLNIYPKFLVQPVIYRKSLLTPFLSRSMCVPLPHSGDLFSLSFRVRSQASWHPSTIPPSCLLKLCIVSFALCLAGKGWFIHSFLHALDIPFAIHTLKSFLNIEMWIFFFFCHYLGYSVVLWLFSFLSALNWLIEDSSFPCLYGKVA